jgi:hypothetical protein
MEGSLSKSIDRDSGGGRVGYSILGGMFKE